MRKNKKPSPYTQTRGVSNVTDFVAEKAARSYRVELCEDADNNSLKLFVPHVDADGGERAVDISFLLDFPNLREPFSEALSVQGKVAANPLVTVVGRCRNLKNGFVKYLRIVAPDASLSDVTTNLLEGFIVWLRREENGFAKYKKMSKQHFEMAITGILRYLAKSPKWRDHLSPELVIRKNFWKDDPNDRTSTEIIPEETYSDIYLACRDEIAITMAKVRNYRNLMEKQMASAIAMQGDIYPTHAYHPSGKFNAKVWANNPYNDLGLCLASLRHRVPGVILSITQLTKMQDKQLLRVVEGKAPFGSIPSLHFCFYPHPRDLVPFIIMLAIHLDYNPETLLKSRLHNYVIRPNEIGSSEIVASPANINLEKEEKLKTADSTEGIEKEILARAKKGRANNKAQPQIRPATDDPDNPASIIIFLEEWTSYIRDLAPLAARDRLFLFATDTGRRQIKTFRGTTTAGNDSSLRNALATFYKDHKLPKVALDRFRTTGLDIVDVVFKGDIRAKQAAGNHASPETTYRLYSTAAQKQRGDESLAQISELRVRWRATRGKIDPRSKPSNADVGAATPGWNCLDPYNGPFTPGKLCSSYGSCPACPHGSLAVNDAYSCAQAWNLLDAIDAAAEELAPDAWMTRWAPVRKTLLEFWLPLIPAAVKEEAKKMMLGKLPSLD